MNVALWLNKMLNKQKKVVTNNKDIIVVRNKKTKGAFGRGPFEGRVPKWYGTRSK